MSGYSDKPLAEKLGIKIGFQVVLINEPGNYKKLLGVLPQDVIIHHNLTNNADFIHYFTTEQSKLVEDFPKLKASLKPNGSLWISWPKKTSNMDTDLTETKVQTIGLNFGLVDIKVASIDETWSGLKFVYRVKDR